MKTTELIERVMQITLSPDHDEDDILDILNAGLLDIAGGGDRQHGNALIAPLPDLFTKDTVTVTAGSETTAMPATFHRGLARLSFNRAGLKRYDSAMALLLRYEDAAAGEPEAYALLGNTLWVRPIPTVKTTLTAYFTRRPEALTRLDTSVPEGLPEHLQKRLLVHYACREIWSDIEQGLDGNTPETLKHDALFMRALTDLERFIGPADGEAQNVADESFSEDNI